MGLFDGFVDPKLFEGGGLLGRLLALQQFQGQSLPGNGSDQDQPAVQSPVSRLSPLLSGYGQVPAYGPSAPSVSTAQYGASSTGNGPDPTGSSPASAQNALLAQYSPAQPVGIPLPPVFVPGTPQNDAFVHSTINAGRAIGNAVGNVLNSNSTESPIAGTTAEPETKGRSSISRKPGGYDDAVKDFNDLNPADVQPIPGGGLIGTLPDGRKINVRPNSSDGRPTVEVRDGKKSIKIRYGDKQ